MLPGMKSLLLSRIVFGDVSCDLYIYVNLFLDDEASVLSNIVAITSQTAGECV
jgi:hypothetical protein